MDVENTASADASLASSSTPTPATTTSIPAQTVPPTVPQALLHSEFVADTSDPAAENKTAPGQAVALPAPHLVGPEMMAAAAAAAAAAHVRDISASQGHADGARLCPVHCTHHGHHGNNNRNGNTSSTSSTSSSSTASTASTTTEATATGATTATASSQRHHHHQHHQHRHHHHHHPQPTRRQRALAADAAFVAAAAAAVAAASVASDAGDASVGPAELSNADAAPPAPSSIPGGSDALAAANVAPVTNGTAGVALRRLPPTVRRMPDLGFRYVFARETGSPVPPSRALIGWSEGVVLQELDAGTYLDLDRGAPLVRSTISIAFSCNAKFFASTHGDHTVKVFRYPEGDQVAFLDGHPRTPWTVRFHPKDPNILATGCLGSEVRIWDHTTGRCIRKHTFLASISCVSFSPDGSLLAVTSGRSLLLWEWTVANPDLNRVTSHEHFARDNRQSSALRGSGSSDGRMNNPVAGDAQGIPHELLHDEHPYHMVDFHPSGMMLMTGVKNKYGTHPDAVPGSEEQFTLKVVVHNFNRRVGVNFEKPVLEVPRVVAYNDAGIHFSPCGTMLAACIPGANREMMFRIAVLSLVSKGPRAPVGTILYESMLDPGRTIALTNLKFSPSSRHLLAGYSFRRSNPVLRVQAENYSASVSARNVAESGMPIPPQVNVVDIYELTDHGVLEIRRSLTADVEVSHINHGGADDEINVAVFAPSDTGGASGVVYGTQKGRVRLFQQFEGSSVSFDSFGDEEQGAVSPGVPEDSLDDDCMKFCLSTSSNSSRQREERRYNL
jgi:WD domain, G-beta repeat